MTERDEYMCADDVGRPLTKDDVVVCAPCTANTPFADNMVGTCDFCGRVVIFRPCVEPAKKKCVTCAAPEIEELKRRIETGEFKL